MTRSIQSHIPDGEWKGFYVYSLNLAEHKMNCFFSFENGSINGYGSDDIGSYTWKGNYDKDLKITLIKSYTTHAINYSGHADENGIWGTWRIMKNIGGFHLWPVSQKSNDTISNKQEEKLEKAEVYQA